MKKLLLPLIIFLYSQPVFSQNQILSRLKQPPPNRFGISDLWSINLNNLTGKDIKGYLMGILSEAKDGLIVEARTKLFTIKAGNNTYTQKDFPDADVNFYNNSYKQILMRTGGAPDGDYTICITVYNENDEVIGQENCIYHSVRNLTSISLISPADEKQIPSNQSVLFSWTPLPANLKYTLKIVELLPGQLPEVAIQNNPPFFINEDINSANFQYPLSARKFIEDRTYAWMVYLKDNPEQTASEIRTFSVSPSLAGGDTTSTSSGNNLRQNNVIPCGGILPNLTITNLIPDSKNAGDYINQFIKVGYFKMKVLQATGNSANLSGEGSILVPWLKTPIAVEFQKIKINSDTTMYSGSVFSKKDQTPEQWPYQWGINVVGNFNWTKNQIKKLNDWLHNQLSGWPVVNKLVKDFDLNQMVQDYTDNPLKLPLGFNNIKGYTIAISEMKFEPSAAYLNCLAIFPVDDDTLAFKGSNISFTPQGPSTTAGELALIEDVSIIGDVPHNNSYEIVIKKKPAGLQRGGQRPGTFISWDCNGFNNLTIDIDILFPRGWLLPIPDNGERVKATLTTTIEYWDDLIAQTSLNRCLIVGMPGIELEVNEAWFDNSVNSNPQTIVFPSNYPSGASQGPDFKGFFIKNANIKLPNNFLNNNQPVQISFQNIIINKFGVTGQVAVTNLVDLNNGSISFLGASIDSLKILLLNSSITDAYLRGKIVLPFSDPTNSQNALLYKINLKNQAGFQVTIQPQSPITADLFGHAKITLQNTSTFDMWLNNNIKFLINLNGSFNLGNIQIGNMNIDINMGMNFQNLQLDFDESRTSNEFILTPGQWSFASPQKFFARFPITIKNIRYEKESSPQLAQQFLGEIHRGVLKFRVKLNLNEKFSGSSDISLGASILKDPNKKRLHPNFNKIEVDTINLSLNLAAVKIKGKVAFFNKDPKFGNGFAGNIKAIFNSINSEASSNFRVGTTNYNNGSEYYRYWFAEAKMILPKEYGITFLPGVAFYGFGAAAWQRINVSNISMPSANEVQNASNVTSIPSSGASFTPDRNIGFGLKLMAVIGTYPEPKTFNLDAAISAQFSTMGGLNKLSFITNFWGMAELVKRYEAPIYGDVTIEYTPPDKLFMMSANTFIKYPRSNGSIITTEGIGNPNNKVNMTLYINGKTNKWYFLAGTPNQTNNVKVLGLVNLWEYAMFGNDIGQFVRNGFQLSTLQGLANAGVSLSGISTQIPQLAGTGRGFSFGTGVNFSVNKTLDMGWLSWAVGGRTPQLRYGGGGGFEINLSLLQYNCNIGINNWYARGNVAAWLYGYARVWLARKEGLLCVFCCKRDGAPESGCEATLAALRAGFWTQAGFPNPAWVQGSAHVYVNVFGLNWSGNVDISWGSQPSCTTLASQTQSFTQEDATQKIGQLILDVSPGNGDVVSPAEKIKLTTAVTCFTPFEIPELQSDGTIKTRTFKLNYITELRKIIPPVTELKTLSASMDIGTNTYYFRVVGYPFGIFRNFDDNSKYRLDIYVTLYEYVNNQWVQAKDKNNNFLGEQVHYFFRTSELTQAQNTNPNPPTGKIKGTK